MKACCANGPVVSVNKGSVCSGGIDQWSRGDKAVLPWILSLTPGLRSAPLDFEKRDVPFEWESTVGIGSLDPWSGFLNLTTGTAENNSLSEIRHMWNRWNKTLWDECVRSKPMSTRSTIYYQDSTEQMVPSICSLFLTGIKVRIWACFADFYAPPFLERRSWKMCFSPALNWLKCTPRVFILRLNKTSKRFPGCLLLMLVVLDLKLSNLLWPNVLLHLSHWRKQDGTDSKISATLEPQLLQPTLSHSTSPVQKVGGGWGEGMGGLNSDLWHYPKDLHVTLLLCNVC